MTPKPPSPSSSRWSRRSSAKATRKGSRDEHEADGAAGGAQGEIFEAHADFVADPELISLAREAVEAGASAERAVVEALGSFRELLLSSTSEYLAARAADLDDVQDRVVKILVGLSTSVDTPNHRSIIVAHELTPSQTASIPVDVIAGI